MLDEDVIRARFRELCAGEPREVIDGLLAWLEKEDGTFPWHAVYMHKLELEQSGRSPHALGFDRFVDWMVDKASSRFPHLAYDPELGPHATRLIELQAERPLTEDELYAFVTRFTAEELSIVGF